MNFVLATGGGDASSFIVMIVIYAVVIGAMYFFMIRPQKKQQKEHAVLLSQIEVGDTVLTSSGMYGVLIDVTEDTVIVEFGSNKNCRIPMQKSAIVECEKPN